MPGSKKKRRKSGDLLWRMWDEIMRLIRNKYTDEEWWEMIRQTHNRAAELPDKNYEEIWRGGEAREHEHED